MGLAAPWLANDRPYYVHDGSRAYWPIFYSDKVLITTDGRQVVCQYDAIMEAGLQAVFPPIPFSPTRPNIHSAYFKPPRAQHLGRTHWLGTDMLGRDVLAQMVHGSRTSLVVGLASMTIALFIGLFLGLVSGYFGNQGLRLPGARMVCLFLGLPFIYYYAFMLRQEALAQALEKGPWSFAWQGLASVGIAVAIGYAIWLLSGRLPTPWQGTRALPLDNLLGRFIEFIDGLPLFIVLISLSMLFTPSLFYLVLLIGFTGWISIARFTRAEVLKLRNSDFVMACQVMGMSTWRIVWKHLLPNAIGPALVAFAFGVGGAIMAESSLSYLGIGIPADVVSWGKLLAGARGHFQAWWLVWFPGMAIFGLILSVNTIGQHLKERN
jgi:peptide/nickel transport system permease protein